MARPPVVPWGSRNRVWCQVSSPGLPGVPPSPRSNPYTSPQKGPAAQSRWLAPTATVSPKTPTAWPSSTSSFPPNPWITSAGSSSAARNQVPETDRW